MDGIEGRRWHRLRASLPVLCLAVLLAGCAAGPRPLPDDRQAAWQELRARLEALEGWHAEGRLSVRMDGDGGQAGFTWVETRDAGFQLRLSGPWGQGAARLRGGDGAAELRSGDGYRYAGDDARSLLARVYGWDIPVAGLRSWLIGLPADGADYTLDRFGRLATLDRGGWHIEYRRYRRVGDLDLPAVLRARNAAADTEVRVVVDDWRPGSADGDAPGPTSPVPLMGG